MRKKFSGNNENNSEPDNHRRYAGVDPRLRQPVRVPSVAALGALEAGGLLLPAAAGRGRLPGQPGQPRRRQQQQQQPRSQHLHECGGGEEAPG